MVNEKQLREEVKKLVARDDVKYVIGYEGGTYGFRVSPSFAQDPDDAEKFIFSPLCVNNLTVFPMLEEKLPLPKGEKEDTRKIGIIVKGCDSRAIVQIIQEKGIRREDVVLLGVPCTGVIDTKKLEAKFPHQIQNVEVTEDDENFVCEIDGKTHTFSKDELLLEKCKGCENPNPVIYDILLDEEVENIKEEHYETVNEFEKKSLEEKWEYWEEQFERCIRCYACRNVCPMCYCKECIADQLSPQWIRRSVNLSENTLWNIMRAYHLAGRCIGCGECERACPMDIPLAKLNKKLEKDVKEMFEYTAGMDTDGEPLLAAFKPDDPEEFIL
jgi:ferredoxin